MMIFVIVMKSVIADAYLIGTNFFTSACCKNSH